MGVHIIAYSGDGDEGEASGGTYIPPYLLSEVQDVASTEGVPLPAKVLRERLPKALEIARDRERELYDSDEERIEEVCRKITAFVEFCERVERETGEPATITTEW